MDNYIPTIRTGIYYSSSADRSANDHTIYVDRDDKGDFVIAIRYKNSEPNSLYESVLDSRDLVVLGQMLINLGNSSQQIDCRYDLITDLSPICSKSGHTKSHLKRR